MKLDGIDLGSVVVVQLDRDGTLMVKRVSFRRTRERLCGVEGAHHCGFDLYEARHGCGLFLRAH